MNPANNAIGSSPQRIDPDRAGGSVSDQAWWLAFRLAGLTSAVRYEALRDHFGTMEQAWQASAPELRQVLGDRGRLLTAISEAQGKVDPKSELERLNLDGVEIVSILDAGYPSVLRQIAAPPPVLFVRGAFAEEDAKAIAVVGTRNATGYGRETTTTIAGDLARAGVTVVSGLASGIDGFAHRAALEAGGRTIAVLGCGINDVYPREHKELSNRIAAEGAVVSDLPPDTKPDRWNFPARNRIISGLSLGVLVVEAPEKSGALITVDFAADQGRDVFAVPGPVMAATSAGCNRLLRDGARLARSAADILEDLRLQATAPAPAVQQPLIMDENERRVLAVLTSDPAHIDEVGERTDLALSKLSAILLTLELRQLVRNVGAQHYVRQ